MVLRQEQLIQEMDLLKELRNTLGKMEIALGVISDAIVWTTKEGIIQWCNTSFDKLVNKKHLEVLGTNLLKLLPLQPSHPLINAQKNKDQIVASYELLQNDKKLMLEISANQIQLGKQDICIVFSIHNITEKKQTEEERKANLEKLEQANKDLLKKEKIFHSLLEDLKESEDRLKKAKNDLEASNNELEQFACIASHDLQEPLRMVSSFTQLLASEYKDKLDNNAQEYINFAVDGAKRMQNLISDLLEYSRVGRTGKSFERVDCNMALKAAITNLTNVIKESNAEVTYDPLPTVSGETFRLIQLFQNLIGNAIKYRSDISPKVHISAKQKDNEWTFSVRDNGIGIDAKHEEKIFVIFQRLHSREKYSGTGIGLALCKKIVEQHKGKIRVESKIGEGSTFYFTIPA